MKAMEENNDRRRSQHSHALGKSFIAAMLAAALGSQLSFADEYTAPEQSELKPLLRIEWRLGPDYPMGIQDSAVGYIDGKLISAGGFTSYPLDVVKKYPDAFAGKAQGFTKLTFAFDPANESAGWQRIADMPDPARQGGAVAVVDNVLYVIGGINNDEPEHTYSIAHQLSLKGGHWTWGQLPATSGSGHDRRCCQLPWPVYGGAGSTAVIGKKIYLLGGADYFRGPGGEGLSLHSEAGRAGSPVGSALLVLDTANIEAGWKRLADCPGVPKFHTAIAAVGGKIYQLGGVFSPLVFKSKGDGQNSYNAVDSWVYDPAKDSWTRLRDMPHGSNRRALVYANRYIILVAGFKYAETWNLNGTVTGAFNEVERTRSFNDFFENTVLVYDTATATLGTTNRLIEVTAIPSATINGDTIYSLGGEGGPRLYHPATLQIGKIIEVIPQ
jgi:N-acetylneuraminic acid mutarotase